ncbi:MAG: hypothetical protein ACRD72_02445 [Candidatus Angelobacter sp.]
MSLKILPPENRCEYEPNGSSLRISSWAEKMIEQNYCDHVAGTDLIPGDGKLYAVLGSRCFDINHNGPRCLKNETNEVLLVAVRPLSPQKRSIKATVIMEATPAEAIQFEGGRDTNGVNRVEPKSFVLHPTYKYLPEWRHSTPINFIPAEKAIPASLDVYINAKRDGSQPTKTSLGLIITVPPLKKEDPALPVDLTTLVLSESLKLIIKDGWEFLKQRVPNLINKSTDLIQLNIGTSALHQDVETEDAITQAIQKSKIIISNTEIEELGGLNRRIQSLSLQRKHLQARVERASSTIDHSRALAEIEELGIDILQAKEKVWSILQGTGLISVSSHNGGHP